MASLRKHRNGIWYLQTYVEGKQTRRSLGTKSKQEATKLLREFELTQLKDDLGINLGVEKKETPAKRISYSDLLHQYQIRHTTLEKSTLKKKMVHFINFKLWAEPEYPFPEDLKPFVFNLYLNSLIEEHGLKPTTANHYFVNIKSIFSWGFKEGFISFNPASGVKKFRIEKTVAFGTLTDELFAQWLPHLDSRFHPIAVFLAYSGCRIMEAMNLKWIDVNGQIVVREGKGKKSRVIPLHPKAAEALQAHKTHQEGLQGLRFDRKLVFGDLLAFGDSRPYHVQEAFRKASSKSGIKITPHGLRHLFVRKLLQKKTPPNVAKMLLGWSSDTMISVYSKALDSDLQIMLNID